MQWWIILLALVQFHDVGTVTEGPIKRDEHGRKECSSETCGPNLHPIPMARRQNPRQKSKAAAKITSETHNGEDMIKTNFTCDDKPYIPGLYADMEANCQIFHLCLKKVVDHFMCPRGTAFDQKYLVCRTEGKKHCKQSPSFYDRNEKTLRSFEIFSYLEEFGDYDNEHFYLELLRNIQNANPSLIDEDITKALILLQFVQASRAKPDLVSREVFGEIPRQGRAMESAAVTQNVLGSIITFILPILPAMYSSEPTVQRDLDFKAPDQTTTTPSSGASDSLSDQQNEANKSHVSSPDPNQKVVQLVEMILETIGDVYGKIKGVSRRQLVQNHVNYLNTILGLY